MIQCSIRNSIPGIYECKVAKYNYFQPSTGSYTEAFVLVCASKPELVFFEPSYTISN